MDRPTNLSIDYLDLLPSLCDGVLSKSVGFEELPDEILIEILLKTDDLDAYRTEKTRNTSINFQKEFLTYYLS